MKRRQRRMHRIIWIGVALVLAATVPAALVVKSQLQSAVRLPPAGGSR